MDPQTLSEMEAMCATLFSGVTRPSPLETIEAQRKLLRLQTSAQYIPQLQYALENSRSQYALFFASKALLQAVSNDWYNVSHDQRLTLQRFLFKFLMSDERGMEIPTFVTKSTILVLCRITKLGWCSDPDLRGVMDGTISMIQTSSAKAVLALEVLRELVAEFELGRSEATGRLDQDARLVAQAFRDNEGLTQVFLLSLQTINQAFESNNRPVLRAALDALHTCLTYDFMSTGYNDNDDVVVCLHIPADWTKHIATAGALSLLFRIYEAQWQVANESEIDGSENGVASLALQCITVVSSTRRSVFDDKSRSEFLIALLEGTTKLMKESAGLSHSESCLHHLCRLLSRIKSHFQLVELAKPQQYQDWLESLTVFTEEVMAAWRSVSTRTVHYLIRLWCALVLPTPYLRIRDDISRAFNSDSGSNMGMGRDSNAFQNSPQAFQQPLYLRGLDNFVPRIVQAFIRTRADMCSAAALEELGVGLPESTRQQGMGSFGADKGMEESLLDDEGMLLELLTPLSMLARYKYGQSASDLAELFVKAMSDRSNLIKALTSGSLPEDRAREARMGLVDSQARLAFLTYAVGAIVGGHVTRVFARVIERLEEFNAELAALVFKMVAESQRIEQHIRSIGQSPAILIFGFGSQAGWRLELATLYFFRCFQGLYIESRARDDDSDKRMRSRPLELVEDSSGFMSFTFLRRGGVSGPASNSDLSSFSSNMSMVPVADSNSSNDVTTMTVAAPGSYMIPILSGSRGIPTASASLDNPMSMGKSLEDRAVNAMNIVDDVGPDSNRGKPAEGSEGKASSETNMSDEAGSASDLSKREQAMNEEATERAAAMQRSIAHRVGEEKGDRALLDIAMRRIFGLLQYAQQTEGCETDVSALDLLVQRALSVLYQLSVGVTIVHARSVNRPRLVSSGRLLLESDVILELLSNPSAERFPLLGEPRNGRARSFLMATLSKLLFTQIRYLSSHDYSPIGEDLYDMNGSIWTIQEKQDERFVSFMKPITTVADGVLGVIAAGKENFLSFPRNVLIGLFRDVRGTVSSATAAREYELCFAWLFQKRFEILFTAASIMYDDMDVMIPMFKLLSEIVYNRGSRISFPDTNPGGLLLFREACKIIGVFCMSQLEIMNEEIRKQRIVLDHREKVKAKLGDLDADVGQSLRALGTEIPGNNSQFGALDPMSMQALQEAVAAMGEMFDGSQSQKVDSLDSGIAAPSSIEPGTTYEYDAKKQKCFQIVLVSFTRMLSGRYALGEVCEMFGDTGMQRARSLTLKVVLSASPKYLMSFPKMAKALINFLGLLTDCYVSCLLELEPPLFARMMACLGEGLVSVSQPSLNSIAARAIESIAVFRCRATAAVHGAREVPADNRSDSFHQIRQVLNPTYRTRGDTTSLATYEEAVHRFALHDQENPRLFASLLAVIMRTLFVSSNKTDVGQSLWQISKPLMSLIFCVPQEFERQRQEFLGEQLASREWRVKEGFDKLFSRVAPAVNNPALFNVLLRTNESFCKQVCNFIAGQHH